MRDCQECEGVGADVVRVTYTNETTEERWLCVACREEYLEGGFVAAVSEPGSPMSRNEPSQGGEPQQFAACTDCGDIYPAQATDDGGFRPIGLENGCCPCGNSEFRAVVER